MRQSLFVISLRWLNHPAFNGPIGRLGGRIWGNLLEEKLEQARNLFADNNSGQATENHCKAAAIALSLDTLSYQLLGDIRGVLKRPDREMPATIKYGLLALQNHVQNPDRFMALHDVSRLCVYNPISMSKVDIEVGYTAIATVFNFGIHIITGNQQNMFDTLERAMPDLAKAFTLGAPSNQKAAISAYTQLVAAAMEHNREDLQLDLLKNRPLVEACVRKSASPSVRLFANECLKRIDYTVEQTIGPRPNISASLELFT